MRRAAKVDSTQAAIVARLREIGAAVEHLHTVGGGVPDLLVAARDRKGGYRTFLLECKTPGEKINKQQAEFIARWPGEIHVCYTPEDAVNAVISERPEARTGLILATANPGGQIVHDSGSRTADHD